MKNVIATMVAVLLCANGYATDYRRAAQTGKFDALSMITMQQIQKGSNNSSAAKGKNAAAAQYSNHYTATIQMVEGNDVNQLASLGFKVASLANNFGCVTTTLDSLQILAENKNVERISFSEYDMNLDLNKANTITGVDLVHEGNNSTNGARSTTGLSQSYTGKGVMIGIFDSGFDPNHAMFLDKNGKSRFKMIIDKNGTAITDPDKIAAYTTDNKYFTHATNVSGIAAGYYKGDNFEIEGVAPEADLAMGPIMTTASGLVALKTLAEYCKEKGQRLVTNMSYGSMFGPHDGSDVYSQALNEIIKKYDIVACNSAGNIGYQKIVQRHTFTSSTDEMKAIFDLNSYDGSIYSYVTTNTSAPINMDIIVLTIVDRCSTILGRYPAIVNGVAQNVETNDDLGSLSISIAKESIHDGLAGYIIKSNNIAREDSYYRIGYIITSAEGQKVVVYNDQSHLFNTSFPEYTKELTSNGTVNSTCSASDMLVVGSYITTDTLITNNRTFKVTNKTNSSDWGVHNGEIAYYSSYGTRYDNTEWPHVVAPGAYITSAYNRYDVSNKSSVAGSDTQNGNTYQFCALSGTSMASPYMAGVAALWLEADPTLTHEQIKAIAQMTTDVDDYCGEGNHFYEEGKQAGAGKVNALAGLQYILAQIEAQKVDTLILDENEAMPTDCSGKKYVILKRTFNTSSYNTVSLPFDMDAEQIAAVFGEGTKVYTYDPTSHDVLTFHSTTDIVANRPFLMVTKAAETSFNIGEVEVSEGEAVATGIYYDFTGYYGEVAYLEEGMYYISGGKFYRSAGKSKIRGYRAFFRPVNTTSQAKVANVNIDGETTSIENIESDSDEVSGDLYNLNGQKVANANQHGLAKGVYLSKGKKFIVQ